jgi:hypothetical protein
VGGLVCKKAKHQGTAVLWKGDGEYELGETGLVDVHYIGSAFTAYHRDCLQAVSDSMDDIPPGFPPIFLPMVVDHPTAEGQKLHLSEDWAFAQRASDLGFSVHASMRPLTLHWGKKGFGVIKDSQAPPDAIHAPPKAEPRPSRLVKISLLHASRGRPEQAEDMSLQWANRATSHEIEYILSTDEDDPPYAWANGCRQVRGKNQGNVDAYDRALKVATGDIIVQMHDDVIPPKGWDALIADRLDTDKPQVLQVSDGGGINPDKPWLIPIAICTRKWTDKCGYFFHPSYISVFCDDDFSMKAHKERVVLDARDVVFKHAWGGADGDETYKRSYRKENWKHGEEIFQIRKAAGFPDAEKYEGPTF